MIKAPTTMLLNPIVAMLKNEARETWHPILFVEDSLPGPYSADKPVRHKSKGHHTDGFASRLAAVEDAKAMAAKVNTSRCELEVDILWNGDGVPALVHFFDPSSV